MDSKKTELINALSDYYGIVTDACRKCGVPRSTYYKWLNTDEEFKSAVEETQEEAIDFVEGQLFKKIQGVTVTGKDDEVFNTPPSDTAIIFYLKTKGKKRGYVEKMEVDNNHRGGLTMIWEDAGFETKG